MISALLIGVFIISFILFLYDLITFIFELWEQ